MAVRSGSGARAAGPGGTTSRSRTVRWLAPVVLVPAAVLIGAGAAATTAGLAGDDGRAVVVRTPDGEVVARVPLTGDRFAVSYRNSVYTTLAEERYRVLPDGRFELVELAADQVAVLEEYYAVPGAPRPAPPGDRRHHVAEPDPARPAVFDVLNIAATDLGERTLHTLGTDPVPIWRLLTREDPTVLLEIER
ncbi:hypothetical protein [Geodermatophilus obscurus]|uniref:Uncharacterized protein n=1 Tax=Geodermatophilus obscurus (strain ATCC 25078 / DSM 43160 / JCM 3152 / CCUG 61914 / KCC A-0152 / KCTC 9177 / NBRC 13315 / NRRL B-3577 / G-20) TaxID=526225 RepID=D2SD19_GEOOG|nr:hypothetical protein [Geodermatophilus obscurus]ADB76368.1 hypothetical protein Gobs_3792 [Geodermatophilus obscurus DSM 43160]